MLMSVVPEVSRAERALHRRAGWACAAATEAGLPGRFRAWEQNGVPAVLATHPALRFLTTVSAASRETLPAAIDVVAEPVWGGVKPALITPEEPGDAAELLLRKAGFTRTGTRLVAIRPPAAESGPAESGLDVIVDDPPETVFADVLLAGYAAGGPVAAYIRAEHRLPAVRRFLLVAHGKPIAAAAMTVHGDVAVLGGASTLPAYRGRGAQSLLVRHRLHAAAGAGCSLAVATARPGSASAANLRRAGFVLHHRAAWAK